MMKKNLAIMKKIDWNKLFECAIFGTLLSMCITVFGILIAAFVKLICLSFELAALVIIFILLVIGITYWAYKNNILDD